ncbi:MAG: 2-dehydro-3-deoxygalactonokinase [Oscillospiraceae bacterium]|nr:2-dehydro-3-deoxygalactonokinase [Oscillospiraceae bacterium]
MNQYVIYFDSGTTNSRVYLLDENYHIRFTAKRPVGSRDSAIEGNNLVLIRALKELYDEVFAKTEATEDRVLGIYASGMITSPYGLYEIPHIVLPQTLEQFAHNVYCYHESKLFDRDIYLVPGIKTLGDDISFTNNTRGEEVEALGAIDDLKAMGAGGKIALILPGSHTHVIYVEGDSLVGIISNFTGEAFHALKTETILAPVLSVENPVIDAAMVSKGANNLLQFGFSRAIYIAHAMRIFNTGTENERYCYAEGVVNGGVRESLEYYCRNVWKDCHEVAIVGDSFMYDMFQAIFDGSPCIDKVHWLPAKDGVSFAAKGIRKILAYRAEHNL